MALISCPECGKQISDKAEKCIRCGTPIGQDTTTDWNVYASKPTVANELQISSSQWFVIGAVVFSVIVLSIIYYNLDHPTNNLANSQQSIELDGKSIEKAVNKAGKDFEASQKAEEKRESRQVEDSRPEITIKAPQLFTEYNDNEVKADKEYKGKVLQVIGTIDGFGTALVGDQIYITLTTEEMFGTVQCCFGDDYKARISQMTKGQYVTIVGKCKGKFINVLLEHCRIN